MSPPGELAWYLYAITAEAPDLVSVEGVLPGSTVDVLPHGGLFVLASQVPRAPFDSSDPANRTAEPDWMADRVAAHHRVNVTAARRVAALPLVFGTMFSSLALVDVWLAARQSNLWDALNKVKGHAEWLISLVEDTASHNAWLDGHDAELIQLQARMAAAGEGQGFLLARKTDKVRNLARTAHLQSVAETTDRLLRDLYQNPIPEPRRDQRRAWSVLDRMSDEPAKSQASQLTPWADTLASSGLSLQISGPWPAYAFARQMLSGELVHG